MITDKPQPTEEKTWEHTTFPVVSGGDHVLGWIVQVPQGGYASVPKKGAWPQLPLGPSNWFGDLGVDTPQEAHDLMWPEPDELLGANRPTRLEALLDLFDGYESDLGNNTHPGPTIFQHDFIDYLKGGDPDEIKERAASRR